MQEIKVRLVVQVQQGLQEPQDQLEYKDRLEDLGALVLLEVSEHQDHKDHLERLEPRDRLDQWEPQDQLVSPDHPVHREPQDHRELEDLMVVLV